MIPKAKKYYVDFTEPHLVQVITFFHYKSLKQV